jgi:virginiamycin B lyase
MRDRTFSVVVLLVILGLALSQATVEQRAAAAVRQSAARGRQGGTPEAQLPEGRGREQVEAACSKCHGLQVLPSSFGYTKEGWQDRISTMIALPVDTSNVISMYLAEHFPPKPAPTAILISGPVTVNIREWLVPTLGSRPHDPLAADDGSIWWTGQFVDKVGRLDPRSGTFREFPIPVGSQPHGLIEDRNDRIWYTAIRKGVIGRLDPSTGEVREYSLNDPAARGPHTPIFDKEGMLFFTLQSGHVGRLNPVNGEMRIAKTPSENTYPYGIQINSRGIPWYVDFRGNRIGRVDPVTMEITEYPLPDPAARPRRLAITPDNVIWYTDFARGYIGRFDPSTGKVKEWLSPGGSDSNPYGIAAIGRMVWYSESGIRPNTLVRFDTETERFQTWAIPSGGGVIRNMMATRDGDLVVACSGVNRVGLVEIGSRGSQPRTANRKRSNRVASRRDQ